MYEYLLSVVPAESVATFHSRTSDVGKQRVLDDFCYSSTNLKLILCTSAFSMGKLFINPWLTKGYQLKNCENGREMQDQHWRWSVTWCVLLCNRKHTYVILLHCDFELADRLDQKNAKLVKPL